MSTRAGTHLGLVVYRRELNKNTWRDNDARVKQFDTFFKERETAVAIQHQYVVSITETKILELDESIDWEVLIRNDEEIEYALILITYLVDLLFYREKASCSSRFSLKSRFHRGG